MTVRSRTIWQQYFGQSAPSGPNCVGGLGSISIRNDKYGLVDTASGVDLPGWKDVIKHGGNAVNPYSVDVQSLAYEPLNGYLSYDVYQLCIGGPRWVTFNKMDTSVGHHSPTVPTSHYEYSSAQSIAYARAVSSLYRAIRGAQQHFAGGVFLGQFHKNVEMVANATRLIHGGLLTFLGKSKKLLRAGGKHAVPGIRNAYLEATYGWNPTFMDCRDAAEAIARLQVEKSRERFRASFAHTSQHLVRKEQDTSYFCGNANWTEVQKTTHRTTFYGAFKGMSEVPGQPSAQRIVNMLGVNPVRDFIPTVWDLIPWSFFVDYFVNVGELLEAATTDTSIVEWVAQADLTVSEQLLYWSWDIPSTKARFEVGGNRFNFLTGTPGRASAKLVSFSRSKLSQVPSPVPRIKLREFGGRRFLNAAALLPELRSTLRRLI